MTALVGILNKHAVAIAADSAVTVNVSSGHKVLNSANKIITLSKYHPIAVMIYSSASFMGTPWDLIIKLYREQLKDGEKNTVKEYIEDFIGFLRARSFFCSDKLSKVSIELNMGDLFSGAEDKALAKIGENVTDENKHILLEKIKENLLDYKNLFSKEKECEGLSGYTYEKFCAYVDDDFKQLREDVIKKADGDESMFELLRETFFSFLKSSFTVSPYTGLVFVGYGKDEIYPSLYSINVSIAFDGVLKYNYDQTTSISEKNQAAVCPFAQTDVINTLLTGIDPLIQNSVESLFVKSLTAYTNLLKSIVEATNNDVNLLKAIDNVGISDIGKVFSKEISKIVNRCCIAPIVRTVEYLEKEDMAEMAESLISLTYLKRRMTSSEESVGGPVDVAIISKVDGVIWIKRKHYFKPELNHHFFTNYYK